MKFHQVREKLFQGENLLNIPLRVTFYARVSTDKYEQINSLDNQINYFENYIKNNKNWIYIEGYIDEGISGTTSKRKNFQRMINDSKKDLFDLIITKEVSRFSRSLLDSIKYTQELMLNDVGVYFQTNEINTYDQNSEFILNMMSSLAQEEIKRLSSRIKWGHSNAIKRGRILGNKITGYDKKDTKLTINKTEAKKIKKIFELYATNKYGLTKLAYILKDQDILNSKGNIYDKETLKRIIQNPKYKGYYRGHTTEIIDYKTKKKINIPVEQQIIYKDKNIPKIVSEELWDKANKILEERSKQVKNKKPIKIIIKKYSYTKKLICKHDNESYQRLTGKRNNNNPRWVCNEYIKYNLKGCKTPIIYEKDLNQIFKCIINKLILDKKILEKDLLNLYSNISKEEELTEKKSLEKDITKLNKKKELILELLINKDISKEEYKENNYKYNKKIKQIEEEINSIDNKTDLNKIKKSIEKKLEFTNIDNYIKLILNKIIISKINNNRKELNLDIYLLESNNYKLWYKGQYNSTTKNKNKYYYSTYIDEKYLY